MTLKMKYNENNKPLECIMTNSTCYLNSYNLKAIKGILWHSTGCNNPYIHRYVQPLSTDDNYEEMMALLGKNKYNNDWNHAYRECGMNFFIGKLQDGTVASVQTLPWKMRPWGCGGGTAGSCNNGWLQFEIN